MGRTCALQGTPRDQCFLDRHPSPGLSSLTCTVRMLRLYLPPLPHPPTIWPMVVSVFLGRSYKSRHVTMGFKCCWPWQTLTWLYTFCLIHIVFWNWKAYIKIQLGAFIEKSESLQHWLSITTFVQAWVPATPLLGQRAGVSCSLPTLVWLIQATCPRLVPIRVW